MARILVAEKISPSGLTLLENSDHQVDVQLNLSPEELLEAVPGAQALIIRSSTQVTAEVLNAGKDLVVVGRAGVGLDNVDVSTATRLGIVVVNDPQSNVKSAAEHTIAMLLSQARNIPQAHAALTAGRWERSYWEGVELNDKTLGILGLGRIGQLVAERALAFGMRILATDPYVSADLARQMGVELVLLDRLIAEADFLSIHVARTAETVGMVNAELLAQAKPGLRVINVARGGVVNEADLAEAIASGTIAGAALDVFDSEPTTSSPLFELDSVVVTPHLGASTREAQRKAGETIARQVLLALAGEFVPNAVNVAAHGVSEILRPYLPLAELLGRLYGTLCEELPDVLDVELHGEIGGPDNSVVVLSVVKGLLGAVSDMPVSYVNALLVAKDRGMEVRAISSTTARDHLNLITLVGDAHCLGGVLMRPSGEPRLVRIDDHTIHIPPAPHMIAMTNDDRPGIIGLMGTTLGDAGINIADMNVGRSPDGVGAMTVMSTSQPVPNEVLESLRNLDGVTSARRFGLADAAGGLLL